MHPHYPPPAAPESGIAKGMKITIGIGLGILFLLGGSCAACVVVGMGASAVSVAAVEAADAEARGIGSRNEPEPLQGTAAEVTRPPKRSGDSKSELALMLDEGRRPPAEKREPVHCNLRVNRLDSRPKGSSGLELTAYVQNVGVSQLVAYEVGVQFLDPFGDVLVGELLLKGPAELGPTESATVRFDVPRSLGSGPAPRLREFPWERISHHVVSCRLAEAP